MNSKMGGDPTTVRHSAPSLRNSAAEYSCLAHAETEPDNVCHLPADDRPPLTATITNNQHVLAGVVPSDIKRAVASNCVTNCCRAQCSADSRLREPGFESWLRC